mgnify:CR=1 FL=1
MKYLVKFFVVTVFIIFSTHAFAEQKIVVLDMKYVLNNSKAGKGAQDFLKKSFTENQKKMDKKEESLKKEESDLIAKKNILSKEEFSNKTNELRKKVTDYQKERRTVLEKITKLRAKARKDLLNKINPIIENYTKENNISFVIDKKTILVGNESFDITSLVIDKLNKELPSLNLK